jgi:putative tryptophan/tyrosine transport system substrate-binding protein
VRRRAFITLLGGAAVWPLAAQAQQGERMRRIGALSGLPESDAEVRARFAALREGLQRFGWTEGRTIHIDYRWPVTPLKSCPMRRNWLRSIQKSSSPPRRRL